MLFNSLEFALFFPVVVERFVPALLHRLEALGLLPGGASP